MAKISNSTKSTVKSKKNVFHSYNWIAIWIANILIGYWLLSTYVKFSTVIWLIQTLPGFYRNDDVGRDIFDLILSRRFKYESHFVESPDGYIVQMVRIINPYVSNRTQYKPIILFHGWSCTGSVWLINQDGRLDEYGNYLEFDTENNKIINGSTTVPNSLGFVLSSRGYDVWLANYRGSIYSTNHTKFASDSDEYWQFSMDEMIHNDFPPMIDYVLNQTGHDSLGYIGHSQGNILMLAFLSVNEKYQNKIQPFIALSPSWYMFNINSLYSAFTVFKQYLRSNPRQAFIQDITPFRQFSSAACSNYFIRPICFAFYTFIGFNATENIAHNRFPVYIYNTPSGTTSWTLVQYMEKFESHQPLSHFDYGAEKNMKVYGQKQAPIYNISNIKSRHLALYYGLVDQINKLESNQLLIKNLQVKPRENYLIDDYNWDHMSFVYGKNVGEKVNKRILTLLSEYN